MNGWRHLVGGRCKRQRMLSSKIKGEMWGLPWIGNYEQMQEVWRLLQIGNYEPMTYEFWFIKKHAWPTSSYCISWSWCLLGKNWVLASWCLAVGIDSSVPHASLASFNFLDFLQLGLIPTCSILVMHFQGSSSKFLARLKEIALQKIYLNWKKTLTKNLAQL